MLHNSTKTFLVVGDISPDDAINLLNEKFGEKEKNFDSIRSLVKDINADLLVLPELFATGYTFTSKEEARSLAETQDGPTSDFLKEISSIDG